MISVHGNYTHDNGIMKFSIMEDFKMNLLRLIPILVVVTCQLEQDDQLECP